MWLFGNSPFVIVGDIVQPVVGLLILSAAFGAAGSLAVLLMWLYFSAAVLLGAEFSAARARLHDSRGAWGMQNNGRVPPGSRAKIGSLLTSSTRPATRKGGSQCIHGRADVARQCCDAAIDRRTRTTHAGADGTGAQEGIGNDPRDARRRSQGLRMRWCGAIRGGRAPEPTRS